MFAKLLNYGGDIVDVGTVEELVQKYRHHPNIVRKEENNEGLTDDHIFLLVNLEDGLFDVVNTMTNKYYKGLSGDEWCDSPYARNHVLFNVLLDDNVKVVKNHEVYNTF